MQFTDLDLDPRLLDNLRAIGFTHPTPIQEQTIPAALDDRDILGSAETGTGKTAAFMLPLLDYLINTKRTRTPRALVLVPTRELALQVAEHGELLAGSLPISFVTVYGGVKLGPQINAFRRGVDVVIATPGRLLDVMGRGHINFERLETLVLDEADRMLDIGFLPDIRRIVRQLPTNRQTMLFSATIAPVYRLAGEITCDPLRVEVETAPTPEGIEHIFYPVLEHRKMDVLEHLLSGKEMESVLVFARTKRRVDEIARRLKKNGVRVEAIHGDREQKERIHALESFRGGRIRVLIATDVAARGIDVTGISHVVNYDVPMKSDDYVHRIGRTGRAEASGIAWTLVAPQDETMADRIQKVVNLTIERRSPEGVDAGRPAVAPVKEKVVRNNGWTGPSRRRKL